MNGFSANDLQGTDLLALARPGDDGAPAAVVDGCAPGKLRWGCGVQRAAGRAGACGAGLGRGSPGQRIEGAVDGGLGDVGEADVVVAGVGTQPGEGLVQMEAGAF